MYTIKMNNDKSLICTVRKTIYQRENLVDKIQFLFPETYGDINIFDTTPILKYVDQANELHFETLAKDIDLYKGYVRCILPVETKITRFAGNIVIKVTFMKDDIEVLKTGSHVLTILEDDTIAYSADVVEKIVTLQNKVNQANAAIEVLNETKADDITYNEDSNELQLQANGNPIGSKVKIEGVETGSGEDFSDGTPAVDFSNGNTGGDTTPDSEGNDAVEF